MKSEGIYLLLILQTRIRLKTYTYRICTKKDEEVIANQMMVDNPITFKDKNGDDIIVYRKDLNTHEYTPIFLFKTDLVNAEKYTELPAQILNTLYDLITHQPGKTWNILFG